MRNEIETAIANLDAEFFKAHGLACREGRTPGVGLPCLVARVRDGGEGPKVWWPLDQTIVNAMVREGDVLGGFVSATAAG